jgi:mannose-6-phosphate isomerase
MKDMDNSSEVNVKNNETRRPWGRFIQFAKNEPCTVKILEIMPNQELSLQKHKYRKEHWYFLNKATVQINNKIINVEEGDLLIINKNTLHKIKSNEKIVRVLEVSFGKFDENDEIRIKDKYGRC